MSKAYVLIRALVKTDAPDGTPVAEQAEALRNEVASNLESTGEDVLHVSASAPGNGFQWKGQGGEPDRLTMDLVEAIAAGTSTIQPTVGLLRTALEDRDFWLKTWTEAQRRVTEWAADDDGGFDSLIALMNDLQLAGNTDFVHERRLQPGEPGYYEPVNALELRQDLALWQIASLEAATECLTATGSGIMRAFTKHHTALLVILKKHKLLGATAGDGMMALAQHGV